jgi:SAM-dependent methyltransferase
MHVIEYLRLAWQFRADPFYAKYLAGRRVLDVGAGAGEFVKKDCTRFVGVELDPHLVEQCQRQGLNVQQMDALSLQFPDGSFEAVHAGQLIEHLAPSDAALFIMEAARVVAPGGFIFLTTPGVKNVWNTFSHVRPYPPDAFRKFLDTETEHLVRGEGSELEFIGAWGTRYYISNHFLRVFGSCLDLLWPPHDPIGWTIILKRKSRLY